MESVYTKPQPHNFFISQFDYRIWKEGEPWDSYIEPCSPAFLNPFDDISRQSSFDGGTSWMDGCEQLRYTNSPLSPLAAPRPFEEPHLTKSKPAETQTKTKPTSKRKRRQPRTINATEITQSKPNRTYRSRSTSSFSPTELTKKEVKPNDEEDILPEQSRIASNKFRARKRNEIAHLQSEEYSIEDANRLLRNMLEALTHDTLALKMQLLQHTDCNCELIQAYINKEAHHFVRSLDARCQSAGRTVGVPESEGGLMFDKKSELVNVKDCAEKCRIYVIHGHI